MGQPAHPNGTRVNNIQVADNSIAWQNTDRGFYFQSYLLSILFKFIRHWLTVSLLVPRQTPWSNGQLNRLASLRSRRALPPQVTPFPDIKWDGDLPSVLKKTSSGRIFDGVVLRYFRQLPPRLVLRDSVEDLIRPVLNIRRPRYTFTFWNRPRILRCTGFLFCILKGVGAGEKTPVPRPSTWWKVHVRERGFWKKTPPLFQNRLHPSAPHWRLEL